MMAGNSFSYSLESAGNHSVQKQYLEMVKKQQKWMMPSTENPIVLAAMNNKKEVTLIESKDQMDGRRSIDHIDRKYIIPLALKVASPVHGGGMGTMTTTSPAAVAAATTTTSTRKPPILPDTSPNIDDLKRHILMLQNLTKNDENFQSKFVVFPSLQRSIDGATSSSPPLSPLPTMTTSTSSTVLINGGFAHTILPPKSSSTTTVKSPTTKASAAEETTSTTTTRPTTTKRTTIATKRRPSLNVPKQMWPINTHTRDDESIQKSAEKITIVPQVFLQNDQTPMNDDSFERPPPPLHDDGSAHGNYQSRPLAANQPHKFSINDPKPTFLSSSMKRSQYASASNVPAAKQQQQHKKNTNTNRNKDKQLRREMRKKCKEAPPDQKQNCTKAFQISFNLTSAAAAAAIRSTKHNANNNRNNNNSNSNNEQYHPQQQQQYHRQSIANSEIRSNSARSKMNYIPPHRSVNTNKRPANNFDAGRMTNDDGVDNDDDGHSNDDDDDDALKQSILQRTIRSHRRHQRRNASVVINSMSRRDYPYSIGTPITATTINETVSDVAGAAAAAAAASSVAAPYKEKIDLNPDLCYKITGLSYGQQKLCAANTQIMPAISRGARAAIQVIQYIVYKYMCVCAHV